MMDIRSKILGVLSVLAMSVFVWSGVVAPAAAKDAKPLVLEEFFNGDLMAEGGFTNVWTGSKRGLSVKMNGHWDGKALTLKEDFAYSDGEADKKTWVFTKLSDGVYSGIREDVTVPAEIRRDGNDVLFSYVAHIGGLDLSFHDRLTQLDATVVRNTADVYWLGFIKVGEVELTIKRAR